MQSSTTAELTTFAEDVLRGLTSTPKSLSSKYFYDDEGSRLFREIMKLPEYYLTGCEDEIFSTQTDEIFRAFANGNHAFDLIELGAGDGTKTAILVDYFLKQGTDLIIRRSIYPKRRWTLSRLNSRPSFPLSRSRPATAIISRSSKH